jgi:long-chain fatty acid transport protein
MISLVALSVCTPRIAFASGFFLKEQSAAGLGMASAVSASTSEPAAVWYNPAALSFMDGVQASLTGTTYLGNVAFSPVSGARVEAEPIRQFVPGAFVTGRVSERVALGLGASVPFGLGVAWPEDWIGRQYAIESSLLVLNINPVVSFKLLKNLSIAAGADIMRGTVDITRGLPTASTDSVRIAGDGWGGGANVAVLYRILPERLHVAASYRSRVKLALDGRGHFEVAEPIFTARLFDQAGKATLTLPDVITLGAMVQPIRELRIGLDLDTLLWSTYGEVPIDFESPETPDAELRPDYRNVVAVRTGAEWSTPLPGLLARVGFVYDPSPAPATGLSPAVPDADRVDVSVGAGYRAAHWSFDLAYMLVRFLPSEARLPSDPTEPPQSPAGTYRTTAHLIGATLSGRFGGK